METVKLKKKVIALVVDTDLTNEELERGEVTLVVGEEVSPGQGCVLAARNVRVLDSDEIGEPS